VLTKLTSYLGIEQTILQSSMKVRLTINKCRTSQASKSIINTTVSSRANDHTTDDEKVAERTWSRDALDARAC
jgi:hypothetical protein